MDLTDKEKQDEYMTLYVCLREWFCAMASDHDDDDIVEAIRGQAQIKGRKIFNHNTTNGKTDRRRSQWAIPAKTKPESLQIFIRIFLERVADLLPGAQVHSCAALYSDRGCQIQPAHRDYDPADATSAENVSVLLALEDHTHLHVWPGSHNMSADQPIDEIRRETIVMNRGDVLVFKSHLVHAGASYMDKSNVRLHCYASNGYHVPDRTWLVEFNSDCSSNKSSSINNDNNSSGCSGDSEADSGGNNSSSSINSDNGDVGSSNDNSSSNSDNSDRDSDSDSNNNNSDDSSTNSSNNSGNSDRDSSSNSDCNNINSDDSNISSNGNGELHGNESRLVHQGDTLRECTRTLGCPVKFKKSQSPSTIMCRYCARIRTLNAQLSRRKKKPSLNSGRPSFLIENEIKKSEAEYAMACMELRIQESQFTPLLSN
jgi:hypothetical protein